MHPGQEELERQSEKDAIFWQDFIVSAVTHNYFSMPEKSNLEASRLKNVGSPERSKKKSRNKNKKILTSQGRAEVDCAQIRQVRRWTFLVRKLSYSLRFLKVFFRLRLSGDK